MCIEHLKKVREASKQRRKLRISKGLCIKCGQRPFSPDSHHCEPCSKKYAEKGVRRRAGFVSKELCSKCGSKKEENKKHCNSCIEKSQAYVTKRRLNLISENRCTKCKAKLPEEYEGNNCVECRKKTAFSKQELKKKAISHYGNVCNCCGEEILTLLNIDHINGGGRQHFHGDKLYAWLIKNNFPEGFQVLCFSCNNGKYLNRGVCPHQEKAMQTPDLLTTNPTFSSFDALWFTAKLREIIKPHHQVSKSRKFNNTECPKEAELRNFISSINFEVSFFRTNSNSDQFEEDYDDDFYDSLINSDESDFAERYYICQPVGSAPEAILALTVCQTFVTTNIWANSLEVCQKVESQFSAFLKEKEAKKPHPKFLFWSRGLDGSATSNVSKLECPNFEDIKANYDHNVSFEIERLMKLDRPDEHGKIILWHGPPGNGKCITPDSYIFTDRGMISIGSLQPDVTMKADSATELTNLKIQSLAGSEKASHFYCGGTKPARRITSKKGFSLAASLNHPILSIRNGARKWVRFEDLKKGDFLAIKVGGETFSAINANLPEMPVKIHGNSKKVNLPKVMSPELAEWLGWYISEGCNSARGTLIFTNFDPIVVKDFNSLTNNLFGLNFEPGKGDYANDYRCSSVVVWDWLFDLGVRGLSAEKTIPSCILESTKEVQIRYLKACFEAEGSVSVENRAVEFSTASEKLSAQIQLLLLNLGIVSSRTSKLVETEKWGLRLYWRVGIFGGSIASFKKILGFKAGGYKEKLLESIEGNSLGSNSIEAIPFCIAEANLFSIRNLELLYTSKPFSQSSLVSNLLYRAKRNQKMVATTQIKKLLDFYEPMSTTLAFRNLQNEVDDSFLWDFVENIEELGEVPVVDVSMPISNSFVANGIISHNTYLIRSLARQWFERFKSYPEVVVDPENFFDQATYLNQVVVRSWHEKPRLIIIEDSANIFSTGCRLSPGFTRLLNMSDGLLGQGKKIVFLLTANETLDAIDSAILRPGRCLQNLYIPPLSIEQAEEWLTSRGAADKIPNLKQLNEVSLAQLYALLRGDPLDNDNRGKSFGF